MTLTEKTAYLKGLMEGLNLKKDSDEGKLFNAIIDTLDDLAMTVSDMDEELDVINEELDAVGEELTMRTSWRMRKTTMMIFTA